MDRAMDKKHQILFIDAFDSFTNNIVGLLEQSLNVQVTVIRIDNEDVAANFEVFLQDYDAVVVGPGPGHPAIAKDVGLINKLWSLEDVDMLPIFGICLGFQSLALAHGAEVKRLAQARHGIVSKVHHSGTDIFENIGELVATQYHSLQVYIGEPTPEATASSNLTWNPTTTCPLLCPLAWDDKDQVNGPILMGVKHTEKPFWGVQFHPESICTSKEGAEMLQNWWKFAQQWSSSHARIVGKPIDQLLGHHPRSSYPESNSTIETNGSQTSNETSSFDQVSQLARELKSVVGTEDVLLRWAKHPAGSITPVTLCEGLGLNKDEIVLLDSQGHNSGRFSILGIVIPSQTMKVTYKVSDRTLRYGFSPSQESTMKLESIDQVWGILQEVLDIHNPKKQRDLQASNESHHVSGGSGLDDLIRGHLPEDCPFWGGFMGYISYEAGLETIHVEPHQSSAASHVPDLNFAFIHRSIVIDHVTSQVYVQSLSPNDWAWILDVGRTLEGLVSSSQAEASKVGYSLSTPVNGLDQKPTLTKEEEALNNFLGAAVINKPEETRYRRKVLECQEALSAGDSYELCLTDETVIKIQSIDGKSLDPWSLYKKLRQKNPAPFGAFLRLSNAVVVGSSPERFLSWDRSGHCQFRPIKGTVKKSESMTREQAHSILNSSKEQAENLMIVDLIRHDLSGVVGAENCKVTKLMIVEEYETVYQLVSVIEGQFPESPEKQGPRGIDVLKASLPPGSMTGAPKKRSCEILRDIEKRPRGIYSGVLGYMDIGGAGDFSVVIRSAVRDSSSITKGGSHETTGTDTSRHFNRDGEFSKSSNSSNSVMGTDIWRIGAGGAITIQSTDEAEFLEMEVKATSALTTFQTI